MKKLSVTFEKTTDTTGYLFSFAKCLSAALRCSRYCTYADDVIAASGFAFRMWVNEAELCPSAMSIWEFKKQKEWTENCGLVCEYTERLWDEEVLEEDRRLTAIGQIKHSVDAGIAAVAWDISGGEWGLIIGYDEDEKFLFTLKIDGNEECVPYEKLGRLAIPLLSILTVTEENVKDPRQLVADTKKIALSHLCGEEWCENVIGIAAYDALIGFICDKLNSDTAWNLEYYLGTYAALKRYAWNFFEKYGE